jgi:hypothetical protein
MKTENGSIARSEWLVARLITAVILCLHVVFWRHAGAFWRDEVNTINLAQSPSFTALTHDTFPVLLPLLVKIWSAAGHSDLWLRSLGLLVGLTIIGAFWAVARATRRPPLFSVMFFGLNLLLLCYGDSLRAYGLGSALVVFTLAAAWSFLKTPSWSRAGILALAATLSVQTLFQNSVFVLAICLGGFAVCARRKDFATAGKILCAGFVAALSLLPYHTSLAALPQAAVELRRGFSWSVTNVNFQTATAFPFGAFTTVWELLAVIVIGFTLLALFTRPAGEKADAGELSLFAGVTLVFVVTLFLGFLWFASAGARPWYFMPPLALVAACFDLGIPLTALPRLVRVIAIGLFIGVALMAATLAWSGVHERFTNADQLAARVAADASPQDYIVLTPWFDGIAFSRYYHGTAAWETLPPLADHTLHRYDLFLEQMKDTNCLAPVLEKISATLRAGHRVWIVGQLEWPPDVSQVPPILPPPPLPGYGWSDPPYMGSWVWRTSYLLAKHSDHFTPVPLPGDGTPHFQENFHLYQAEGWHD